MKNPLLSLPILLGLLMFRVMVASATSDSASVSLETLAERSSFVRTGRYDEVQRLCASYAHAWPDSVRCVEFGRTPEGRPMLALVASRSGALAPQSAHKRGMPVMLVQGGIHAGEIDGKDAGLIALR